MPMLSSPAEAAVQKNLRYNVFINLLDGMYFGVGIGFGSFTTIITLFVTHLTGSAVLIGLIPAIHAVGWQLPQLFTAGWVARQRRYKPMVIWLSTQERIPFLGLVLIAWFLPAIGVQIALILTFVMLIWQGIGAGITANPWQSLIAKIIPSESRGSFFGMQAALANIFISIGAVLAGFLLDRTSFPVNFAACFLMAAIFLGFSLLALGLTREVDDHDKVISSETNAFWHTSALILRRDRNFDTFLLARILSLFGSMAFSFYVVYALRRFDMNMVTAGFMTATLAISSTLANALMGWAGDRLGHRSMLIAGALSLTFSALAAWAAPDLSWFYLVFFLAGLANASIWTIGMAMTVEFGSEAERPVYIGLSNTLTAPATILSPLLGGLLAEAAGFQVTFLASAACGLVTLIVLVLFFSDPNKDKRRKLV